MHKTKTSKITWSNVDMQHPHPTNYHIKHLTMPIKHKKKGCAYFFKVPWSIYLQPYYLCYKNINLMKPYFILSNALNDDEIQYLTCEHHMLYVSMKGSIL
jgi:hypothetical protein